MLAYTLASKPCFEATNMLFFSCIGLSLAAQEIQTVVFLLKRKEDRMQKMGLFNFFFGMTNVCLNFQQFHSQPKHSPRRESNPYICGLGARFGCERLKRAFKPPRLKSQIQGLDSLRGRLFCLRQIPISPSYRRLIPLCFLRGFP